MNKDIQSVENVFDHSLLDPKTLWGAVLYAALFLALALLAGRLLRAATRRAVERGRHGAHDHTTIAFLGQLGQIAIFILAFIFYAHLIPQLRALGTALLAGVSVASIVIGLAAQTTLGNLVAGISLLVYRPFRAGDRIRVTTPDGPESGIVEDLTLGYTILQTLDNRRIVVPNSLMTSQATVNLTMRDPLLLFEVPFTIGYGSSIDRARAILLEMAGRHPMVHSVENCPVTEHGAYGLQLLLRVWCRSAVDGRDFRFYAMEAAKNRFDAEGIEIPYPYANVVFKNPLPEDPPAVRP